MSITVKVMPTKTKPVEQHADGTQREQFKELGPLDVARDEREEDLGMQLFEHSCNGVTFDAIAMECTGTRSPASKKCLGRFLSGWTLWARFPQIVTTDRRVHNRGSFARGLKSNGVERKPRSRLDDENVTVGSLRT